MICSIDEALERRPDLAMICSPASTHTSLGSTFASAGSDIFVEKPIGVNLQDAKTMLAAASARGRLVAIGYVLRFAPTFRSMCSALEEGRVGRILSIQCSVGQYLPDWRPQQDYRLTASAFRDGGGAIMELSHELNYIQQLGGEVEAVAAMSAKISDLDLNIEDTADLLLRFSNGVQGNVHLDMTDRSATRWCRVTGTSGTLTWNALTGELIWSAGSDRVIELTRPPRERITDEMFFAQAENVLSCVRSRKQPLVCGEDGTKTLRLALAAKQAAFEGRTINLLDWAPG